MAAGRRFRITIAHGLTTTSHHVGWILLTVASLSLLAIGGMVLHHRLATDEATVRQWSGTAFVSSRGGTTCMITRADGQRTPVYVPGFDWVPHGVLLESAPVGGAPDGAAVLRCNSPVTAATGATGLLYRAYANSTLPLLVSALGFLIGWRTGPGPLIRDRLLATGRFRAGRSITDLAVDRAGRRERRRRTVDRP